MLDGGVGGWLGGLMGVSDIDGRISGWMGGWVDVQTGVFGP